MNLYQCSRSWDVQRGALYARFTSTSTMGDNGSAHSHVLCQYPGSPGETNSRLHSKRQRQKANSKSPNRSPTAKSWQPQEHRVLVPALHILQLIIKSLPAAKQSLIKVFDSQHSIEVICLQEMAQGYHYQWLWHLVLQYTHIMSSIGYVL